MKKIVVPTGVEKAEVFQFLKKNKDVIIQQKKILGKEGEGVPYFPGLAGSGSGTVGKGVMLPPPPSSDVLQVKAVINTTNWLDSTLDCHMPGLWTKSLQENKMLMHLKEHSMKFEDIIADGPDLRAGTQNMTWASLGYNYPGSTEALVFDSTVRKSRNPYMFDQYAKGYVKNHSVYMMYVKMVLCINESEDLSYGAEYEAWQKYIEKVVNKSFAEEMGYFWAILEAKVIEGSSVPRGSNILTPTLSVSEKEEPKSNTPKSIEPPTGTPKIYKLHLGSPKEKGWRSANFNLKTKQL